MIKLAEALGSEPSPLWDMVKQTGIRHAVAGLPSPRGNDQPWDYLPLLGMKNAYDDAGIEVAVIESRPPLEKAKRGLPGRDEEIDTVCTLLDNMGRLGIPVWCYEWMAGFNWLRTSTSKPGRGGALVTAFDFSQVEHAPVHQSGPIEDEALWDNLAYFLEKVIPVAESSGVALAMHPDDPPLSPIRGVSRIMRSIENYRRLLSMSDSPQHGIALCQGNFTLMTDDLPSVIREFGSLGKVFFVHFRDVRGDVKKFEETFHDEGKTDLLECFQAYKEVGFNGVIRPDHVPTMKGDDNNRPGYSSIGRLFAIGYIKGLMEAVYGKHAVEE